MFDVPPEPDDPPPHADRPAAAHSRIVQARTDNLARLRPLTNGNPSKIHANNGLILRTSRRAAVVWDWVAIVTVKVACVFPVRLKLHVRHILRSEPDGQRKSIYHRHTVGRRHNEHSGRRSAGEIFSIDQPCARLLGHRFIYLQQFARECILQFQPFQLDPKVGLLSCLLSRATRLPLRICPSSRPRPPTNLQPLWIISPEFAALVFERRLASALSVRGSNSGRL